MRLHPRVQFLGNNLKNKVYYERPANVNEIMLLNGNQCYFVIKAISSKLRKNIFNSRENSLVMFVILLDALPLK